MSLFRDILGLRIEFEHETTVELAAERGDRVQVFGPGDPYYDFFRAHAAGPVALFEVDDVDAARRELEAAGIELVGPAEQDAEWTWIHFRGPDGNLYELASPRRTPE